MKQDKKTPKKETTKKKSTQKHDSLQKKSTQSSFKGVRFVIWLIVLILIAGSVTYFIGGEKYSKINTSDGIELIKKGDVESVTTTEFEQKVQLKLKDNYSKDYGDGITVNSKNVFFYYVKDQGSTVWQEIKDKNFEKGYDSDVPQSSIFDSLIQMFLPLLLIFGVFYFAMSKMGGGNNVMNFGKSKSTFEGKTPDTTFEDVAGIDEAVEEMFEIRDFMSSPKKYHEAGAKIPKGVLLYGPPGTGKTLLAKAVAGEAKVPFFSISGSDFVEMFVGVGASRVRDLFKKAKAVAPSIIFIDEIDAVGRHRGSGVGGGHDEREQTLNQMLVEMDGFDDNTSVLIIAATNRPDILDPALLRPGRFDRQISVDAPDLKGRRAILDIYAKNKSFDETVDLDMIAKRTPGYTGADLANVVNEATLLAVRLNKKTVTLDEFDEAIDRVMAGPQKKSRRMNENDLKNTAYHEAGHAIVAAAMHYTDPVTKITILPRGKALGYTSVMPSEDRYSITRNQLLDQMAYAMGGRVAEEVVFEDPSTGASNDIEKATDIARKMVTLYGMSEKIGPVKVAPDENEQTIGQSKTSKYSLSGNLSDQIDSEIHKLLENAHREALTVIEQNRSLLDKLANELLARETLLEDDLTELFSELKFWGKRKLWDSFSGDRSHLEYTLKKTDRNSPVTSVLSKAAAIISQASNTASNSTPNVTPNPTPAAAPVTDTPSDTANKVVDPALSTSETSVSEIPKSKLWGFANKPDEESDDK